MTNFNLSSNYCNFLEELIVAEKEVEWADKRREASSLLKEFSIPDVSHKTKKHYKSRV